VTSDKNRKKAPDVPRIVRAIEPQDAPTPAEVIEQLDSEDVRAIKFQMKLDVE
jgi:hypothetical protein